MSVSGTRVNITPVAAGTTTVTVRATDAGGSMVSATQTFTVTVMPTSATDYDADDDGLIEIATLARLDAVRYDPDGDGEPTADGATAYAAAFSTVGDRQACGGPDACIGYELGANLTSTPTATGRLTMATRTGTAGPAGSRSHPCSGLVSRRFSKATGTPSPTCSSIVVPSSACSGNTSPTSVIRHVGLIDVSVAGRSHVGSLVGRSEGSIVGCYATGIVTGTRTWAGGLVGGAEGSIAASYAAADVTGPVPRWAA